MIEAAEYATATQRELHRRHQARHLKFFPPAPVVKVMHELAAPEPPPPVPEPAPPIPQRAAKLVKLEHTRLRMRIIRRAVCQNFEITKEELLSDRRTAEIVLPRHVYSYMATRLTKASLPMIARSLGQDHTTILHAIRRTAVRVSSNHQFGERLRLLEATIRAELGEDRKPVGCIGRYVVHDQVSDYLLLGWWWPANINPQTALLIWPCACRLVEPKQ